LIAKQELLVSEQLKKYQVREQLLLVLEAIALWPGLYTVAAKNTKGHNKTFKNDRQTAAAF